MVGRMPVLRGHDQVIVRLEAIDQRHDLIAFGHGEGAARAEVVLDIDDDECRHRSNYSSFNSRSNPPERIGYAT